MALWCYMRQFGRSAAVGAATGVVVYSALHWPHTKSCPKIDLADPIKSVNPPLLAKWDPNWDM